MCRRLTAVGGVIAAFGQRTVLSSFAKWSSFANLDPD